jgi:hypothetical protein
VSLFSFVPWLEWRALSEGISAFGFLEIERESEGERWFRIFASLRKRNFLMYRILIYQCQIVIAIIAALLNC